MFVDINASDGRNMSGAGQFLDLNFVRCALLRFTVNPFRNYTFVAIRACFAMLGLAWLGFATWWQNKIGLVGLVATRVGRSS